MKVSPIGEFNAQELPLIEGKIYDISKKELQLLGEHKLKWKIEKNIISLIENDNSEYEKETFLNVLRRKRKPLLQSFDLWEKAVTRGREEDSEEIMKWYYDILDLKEEAFENIPSKIKYYMQ